jgi:hypothetical protein
MAIGLIQYAIGRRALTGEAWEVANLRRRPLGTSVIGVAFLLFLPFSGSGPGGVPLLGLTGITLVFKVAYFGILGAIAVVLGLALLAVSRPLSRLMGGVR